MFGAAAGGALLGSAWAAAFRDALTAGNEVHITIARTATALGVLFEHHQHRVMLLDAADGPGTTTVTELSTGFMRRRIDTLVLSPDAAATLPREYPERWNVRDVWAAPDPEAAKPSSLTGKSLQIGGLTIDADALPVGAWRADIPSETGWYVAASLGSARFFVTNSGNAITRLPLDATVANAVVCSDVHLELDVVPPGIDALLVPTEVADAIPVGPTVVSLSQNASTTLRLHADRIETP